VGNCLTGVSGGASAAFVYDGDGARLKATFGTVTTVYIDNLCEKNLSTSGITKYYYFANCAFAGTCPWSKP